ncbi:MAG: hypothetical protein IJX77_07830 [Ruminococcus sp.]|nr:hypothetical protein [Ruminococcus sp.]
MSKKKKKKKQKKEPERELTPYEKAGMYTILSTEETETHTITTMRTYGGATVICRIPKHTPEEEQKLKEDICEALIEFAYPKMDRTKVKSMKVIV